MAGNIRIGAGVETPAQSRTSVSGGFSLPARPAPASAPAPQAPVGYGLAYQMGGPNYMYGVTPRYGAYYRDGGTPPGQIYGNFPGAREGADMFGFWPTMFQTSPYATASQMYTPGLGVMPLVGYPSRYPHVIMGGYSDYGAPIANQAMNMMLPLLMMGLYRQMFPMPGMAPGAAGGAGGRGGAGGGRRGGGAGSGAGSSNASPATSEPASATVPKDMQPTPDLLGIALHGLPGNYSGENGRAFFTEQTPQFGAPQIPHTPASLGASRQAPAGLAPKSTFTPSAPASAGEAQDMPIVYRDYNVYSPDDAN